MSDIVTRKFGDSMHHVEHLRNNFLQDICLFADDLICDLIRHRQNALQATKKARRQSVIFVSFLQELIGQVLPLPLINCKARARTSNVTPAIPKTAFVIGFN